MSEFPDEMSNWKLRADWLVKGFFPTAKGAIDLLKSLLQLLNGNSMEPVFTHWCLPGCCDSQQESLKKVTEVAIPLFSRGFQCPLLYRFKHYTVASSYLRTACCCFHLLPQVLTQLNAVANEQDSKLVDGLLQNAGASVEHTELGDLLDNDLSFSLQNSVRRRKVVEQVSKAEFPQSVIMVDVIVNALEYGSNALFKRTSLLTRMSNLGSHHPEYTTLAKECMERFLDMASGSFGKRLVERTVLLLDDGLQEMIDLGGFSPTPERLVLFFRLIVSCMSDLWRRMIFEFSRYPWKWFDILAQDLSLKQFVEKFDQVQAQSTSHCCSCVDSEFSQVILAECLTSLSKEPMHEQYRIYNDVKQVLQQVAQCSPMNADKVEVKHGNMQWCVAKRASSHVKRGKTAVESAFLQTCIQNHGVAQQEVSETTMPSGRSKISIERQLGISSRNQHSINQAGLGFLTSHFPLTCNVCLYSRLYNVTMCLAAMALTIAHPSFHSSNTHGCPIYYKLSLPVISCESPGSRIPVKEVRQRRPVESSEEKNLRVQTAAHRAVRSLSGWNIFQRENTQGVQMGTAEYKSHLQNLSAQWKSLSQDDKAAWNIQARHEQMCREELVGTPLPAKGEGMSELDLAVGRKGRSKLSGKRLQLNTELYNQHFLWSTPTQLGDGLLA